MDYETKIYLEKLIEAVDSPDWWNVIATFVAAFVAAVITWIFGKRQEKLQQQQLKLQEQQNELQKRQTEAAEFELYKRLALIIKEIHFEAKFVMFDVNHYLVNRINMYPNNIWRQRVNKCIDLNQRLDDCTMDIELKFSKGFIDIDAYKWVLMSMSQFSSKFESLLLENKVDTTNKISIKIEKPYLDFVNLISQRVEETDRNEFAYLLLNFLNAKDCINEDETMSKIKNSSKID